MPSLLGRLSFAVVQSTAPAVRASAQRFRGACLVPFSQCAEPVRSLIGDDHQTRNGICAALSMYWVGMHSMESSLWSWLLDEKGAVIASKLKRVQVVQKQSKNDNNGVQAENEIERLALLGLVLHRGDLKELNRDLNHVEVGSNSATAIPAEIFRYARTGDGTYWTFHVGGLGGGHEMAAYVGLDAVFFDPNYGEFYFEKAADFAAWFPEFWRLSKYSIGLNKYYYLLNYAKSVKFKESLKGEKNYKGLAKRTLIKLGVLV